MTTSIGAFMRITASGHTKSERRQPLRLLLPFLVMLVSPPLSAQETDWASLMAHGNRAFIKGRYGEAEADLLNAFNLVKNLPESDLRVPKTMALLGHVYVFTARYKEAEYFYLRALDICQRSSAQESIIAVEIMDGLGTLYRAMGRYAEAEQRSRAAVAMGERTLGLKDPYLGAFYHSLAIILLQERKLSEATKTIDRAVALWTVDQPNHLENIALAMGTLGDIQFSRRRYREAEISYQRALSILENPRGPAHPLLLSILTNLASLYVSIKKYVEAETIGRLALSIADGNSQRPIGKANVEIVLGRALAGQKRFADAEPHFRRGLASLEAALGPHDTLYAAKLLDYADALRQAKRSTEASTIEAQVKTIVSFAGNTVSIRELQHSVP